MIKIAYTAGRGAANQEAAGTPWGVVCEGVSGGKWGHTLIRELSRLRSLVPTRDLLLGRSGSPIGHSTARSHFRRCLVKYCNLVSAAVAEYTMHAIKRTFLTWAQQAGVGSRDSAAQGHHREPNVSACQSMDVLVYFHNCVVSVWCLTNWLRAGCLLCLASWYCSSTWVVVRRWCCTSPGWRW